MASRRGHAKSYLNRLPQLVVAVALALVAGACTHVESTRLPPEPTPPPAPQAPAPPPAAQKNAVAIVVSSNAPAYLKVARAIAAELDRDHLRYSLDTTSGAVIRDVIDQAGHPQVIAIGHAAAEAMRPMGPERMLYCQVFYDNALRDAGFRGVAATPPYALQLDTWTRLEPRMRRVGLVAGQQSKPLVRDLIAAAEAYGITVLFEEVASDKQALFVFQRLIPEIDGYVFLPDTEVLSPNVIRKMMRYGVKHEKSMLVYTPALLELGGSLLIGPEPEDVARQIVRVLDADGPEGQRRALSEIAVTVPPDRQVALVALLTERDERGANPESAPSPERTQ